MTQPGRNPLAHRDAPCAQCPWRKDTPPGKFAAERFEALAHTSGTAGHEAPLGSPLFACHMSATGAQKACAGWLAAVGIESLPVRLAIVQGALPADALTAKEGWPELFESYDEMAQAQGRIDPPAEGA
jgi:hypothetical protein